MAYWTEDGELARRAGWEVREVKRPASFEEGVPKEWRTAYVVAPFGFDFSAVEKAVVERVDRAESGIAYIRPVEWPVPEAFLWFVLRDRWPYREGESVAAYSVDWLSVEERLLKLREAFKARDYREAGRIVRELSEAGETRTLWQLIYQFDKERASAALDYLRQKYNEPEDRLWERHDELYKVWLAFRLADEYEAYLKSGAGREMKKEEAAEVRLPGAWAPGDLMPLFWLRLLGDPEGGDVFKDVWAHAINIYYEGMTHPYTPKKKAAARRALELFNAYMQTSLKYEDLFPPEEARAEKTTAEEARRPARQTTSPQTAERAVVEAERAIKAEAVKAEEAVEKRAVVGKAEEAAPLPDLIPDGIDPVLYLVGRFGHLLDEDAADKARGFVYAKLRAKLEKIAAKEPELAAALAELAERVLWSLGGLLASPEAARHAHDALFYHFEGYYTKDGERLYERIRGAVEEAVRRAEEAGVIDAEYRVKQWVLTVVDILATAGERYRRDGLKAISTVERALRTTAFAGLSAASLYSLYQGLYSEAVVSAVASAVALAEAGRFKEAVERVKSAAEALYESAKELFERARITLQRLVELFVEAVARALAWADAHKAYLFLMAAVAAGLVALQYALDLYGSVDLVMRAGGLETKYWVYLGTEIQLQLLSTNPEEVEKAAHLLRLAGVKAEASKAYDKQRERYMWSVIVTTDRLAAKDVSARLRETLAEAVKEATQQGYIDGEKAEKWIEKLERGVTVAEDMPKFSIQISGTSGLNISYHTTNAEVLNKYAERLRRLGLEKDIHFTYKEPKDGKLGRLAITVEGVIKLGELSVHAADGTTRREAAKWVRHLLARAREGVGEEAWQKLKELIREGGSRGAYALAGVHQVEVGGERHVVEVKEAKAWIDDADKLRIKIKAVIDGVDVERELTFFRYKNKVDCQLKVWASAPGGREADKRRLEALSIVIFGNKPSIMSDGGKLRFTRRHLEYAMRFKEPKDVVERWLTNKMIKF